MQIAIYSRVSTERQEREQTIESQLFALHEWAREEGHQLEPKHVYTDEGYSGSRLDRPGLDRLRDAAQAGEFEAVAVWTPDRLARKYAYQVLLLEELQRAGCAVVFVHHPLSDDPNDQLLLQI
jgi:site-specific DNA recombinase